MSVRASLVVIAIVLGSSAFGEKTRDEPLLRPLQNDVVLYVCSYLGGGLGSVETFDSQTGEKIADIPGVSGPVDLDSGPDDAIFVTDERTGEVRRLDLEAGQFVPYGQTSDYLEGPRGLAFSPDGRLYVADMRFTPETCVLEFDENGDFIRPLPDDPQDPVLLAIEDVCCSEAGDIYVTQWFYGGFCENPGVYKFAGDGWELVEGTDNLEAPWGLTFGPDGNLYVAEDSWQVSAVYCYDVTTGSFKGVYGETGSVGNLVQPRYLTFGPDGDLYVSDAQDATVRRFAGPLKPDAGKFIGIFSRASGTVAEPIRGLIFASAGGSSPSPRLFLEKLQSGEVVVTLTGSQGKSYDLRYSSDPTISDFTEWTFGATIYLEGKTSDAWTDQTAQQAQRRFYKAAEQ